MLVMAQDNSTFVKNTTNKEDSEAFNSYQSAACYDQFDGYGGVFNIHDPIDDLQTYGWDDRISSCCFDGFWLLYEDKNYNKYYPNAMVYYGYGENHCRNFNQGWPSFNNRASSIRQVYLVLEDQENPEKSG